MRAAVPNKKKSSTRIQFRMKFTMPCDNIPSFHFHSYNACHRKAGNWTNEKVYVRLRLGRRERRAKKTCRIQNRVFNSLAMLAAFRANPFERFRWCSAIAIFPAAPCWLPLISLIYCTTHPNVLDSIAFRTHHLQFRSNGCAPNLNEWQRPHSKKGKTQCNRIRLTYRCGRVCSFHMKMEKK